MTLVALLSVALASLDAAFLGEAVVAPPPRNPVVLVHGIYSSPRDMTRLARHLERCGHRVVLYQLDPNDGRCGLDELARGMAEFVEKKVPAGPFDVVGFSMGGLVSRYYVQRLAPRSRIEHFVTLATPHRGTWMAGLNRLPGVLQMRRGSTFLRDLERDRTNLRQVKFTSIYTPLDLMIVPANSSELPEAENIRVWALLHPSLILEKRCNRAVASALTR